MSTFPQLQEHVQDEQRVVLKTTLGEIGLRLFPSIAPKTVANFIGLAKQGYYDNVIFHRVIKDFMIQGGDPTGTGMGGTSIYGEKFEDEFSMEAYNFHGALSMANAGPNTNGSQFFIVTAKEVPTTMLGQLERGGWPSEAIEAYAKNGGTPWLDQRHTVFGQVYSGMDIVYAIENVAKNSQDRPNEDVVILSVEILEDENNFDKE